MALSLVGGNQLWFKLLLLELFDLRDDYLQIESRHHHLRRILRGTNSPSHMAVRALARLQRSCWPAPFFEQLHHIIALGPMRQRTQVKNLGDFQTNEFYSGTQCSPSSLFVFFQDTNTVLFPHPHKTNGFWEGLAVMTCVTCRNTWQPDNSVAIVVLLGQFTSRLNVHTRRRWPQDVFDRTQWGSKKGCEARCRGCISFRSLVIEPSTWPDLEDDSVNLFIYATVELGTFWAALLAVAKLQALHHGDQHFDGRLQKVGPIHLQLIPKDLELEDLSCNHLNRTILASCLSGDLTVTKLKDVAKQKCVLTCARAIRWNHNGLEPSLLNEFWCGSVHKDQCQCLCRDFLALFKKGCCLLDVTQCHTPLICTNFREGNLSHTFTSFILEVSGIQIQLARIDWCIGGSIRWSFLLSLSVFDGRSMLWLSSFIDKGSKFGLSNQSEHYPRFACGSLQGCPGVLGQKRLLHLLMTQLGNHLFGSIGRLGWWNSFLGQ